MDSIPSYSQPPLPPPSEQLPPRRSWLPIFLALGLAMIVCTALFFLTIGFFGPVVVLGGGIFAFAALHYVVWGWWLSKHIRADVEAEEARSAPNDD